MALSRRERREQRWKMLKEQRLNQLNEKEDAVVVKTEHKGLLGIYDRYYKELLIIPLALFVIAIVLIGHQIATTGDFLNKGVSLKGGMVITVPTTSAIDIVSFEKTLRSEFPKDDLSVRTSTEFGVQKAIVITTDNPESEKGILNAVEKIIGKTEPSVETTGSSLGGSFFKQTMIAMVAAFILMGIVVFVSFRVPIPSIMVVTCVLADIVETIAAINFIGLKVSTAGLAALLMLIGYSVDTDILLTSRVLRGKEGTVFTRIISAAKTGLMMTSTAIVAVAISLIMTNNETIREIMIIMVFGLFFDIINTWLQNTALLRWYVEWKAKKPFASTKEVEPEIIDIDEDEQK